MLSVTISYDSSVDNSFVCVDVFVTTELDCIAIHGSSTVEVVGAVGRSVVWGAVCGDCATAYSCKLVLEAVVTTGVVWTGVAAANANV